ncbi:MAG: peptide deformylase [Bacteroidota bacterium]
MILPIYPYGSPVLRTETTPVEADSPALQRLLDDMVETMHGASGIGLAAPQVGRTERLFVIDLSAMAEDIEEELGEVPAWAQGPVAFINPEIEEGDEDDLCDFEEGCLSIPDIRENVVRPDRIHVRFLDRSFEPQETEASGVLARVVQHEFDHLNGVLFLDHISPLRRRLLKRRLREMAQGRVEADYPLADPKKTGQPV